MNYTTVVIGAAAVLYGVYTVWARKAKPEQFWKLDSMKRAYGERAGSVVHVVGYTVIPIIMGIVFIVLGMSGGSLF